ncbi:hypothetical protein CLOBY_41020 [Clostridium saccharobutylicum]|uniref:Putative integral membrane protein n=2 Tax=Clostridium saccharobutylicum TaxID=169679 RepID=U5MX86_CLOSA|nr:hypothetical protein [Clostridium saccharobutylicum]AGX45158.1 putative integral membrane protein [Clostridium saccharobutylicum DSM 13864]AQR92437.1 hypothetical protein CLOSC_41670 [Clostridium saccharobutylicum]AQS02340.1 hypothetical protein CSACC_41730 [Clostridium saccharobutylicum]AQS11944.1 hypothetical protein CLOBY_41020 [Clostridium saccharobutylicum]AQS16323.1 hypothetical protein CLOSACC_41730 [Clostridium saccharobutylicum]
MQPGFNIKSYLNIIDKKIIEFVDKNLYKMFIIIVSICAFIIRVNFLDIKSSDYDVYICKWGEYLANHNGFLGIASINSDYNVPYLYILASLTYVPLNYMFKVKFISIIFDYIGAMACYLIMKKLLKNNKNFKLISTITYSLVLFIPTVILNSSAWAQCDIIYVTFILFSIYYLLDKKYVKAFLFYGLAMAFKLQAIFIFPLYVILYFNKKDFSIINFFIIPMINVILYIPAFLFGRPLNLLWNVYFNQIGEYTNLTLNFPNIYNLIYGNKVFSKCGIIFTIISIGILSIYILGKRIELDNTKIIELALLLTLVETYFLPSMHDRYMFLADILSVVYFLVRRKNIVVPVGIIGMSLNVYMTYLFGVTSISMVISSIIQFFIVIKVFFEFINFEDKKILYENKNSI